VTAAVQRRHVPIRTCAGCREEHPKREMVRIVRSPEGVVSMDLSGRKAGRGTYVSPRTDCWTRALKTGSLARVLKTQISEEDLAELQRLAVEGPWASAAAESAASADNR